MTTKKVTERNRLKGRSGLRTYIDLDLPPFALVESQDAESESRKMSGQDGKPYVDGLESDRLLYSETDAERNHNLRNDRDI